MLMTRRGEGRERQDDDEDDVDNDRGGGDKEEEDSKGHMLLYVYLDKRTPKPYNVQIYSNKLYLQIALSNDIVRSVDQFLTSDIYNTQ